MASGHDPQQYPDDFFDQTRMTFGDHLEELRLHLWRAIAGFGVAMILCFFIGKPVLKRLIIEPVEVQLGEFWERRVEEIRKQAMANPDALEAKNQPKYMHVDLARSQVDDFLAGRPVAPIEKPEQLTDEDWVPLVQRIRPIEVADILTPALQALGPKPSMKTMNVTEAFMVYFKVSLVCGLVVSSPWVFWQIWMFVAAGLYPHEKRLVHVYLPVSLGLFLGGAILCQFVVLPKAIEALLWFNQWLSLDPDLRLNEWLSFAIWMPIVFGISFQTPLVMLFLYRIGIVDIETYKEKRKMAFFILAVFAALITPSIDMVSMFFLWGPLCLLYQLGIWLCMWSPRQELEIDEPDELVEV
jgi:sec-independent protein translocase protein TatC